MNKQVTPISHDHLELLSSELLEIKDRLKPLRSAEAATTRDIKKILGDELHLAVGDYSIGTSHLSYSNFHRTDIKTFVEELRKMGVEASLIGQAMEKSQNVSTRLMVSNTDLRLSQSKPSVNEIPQSIPA